MFKIKYEIVQVLIADLLFHPESDDALQSRERALRFFTVADPNADKDSCESDDEGEVTAEKPYTVVIKSSRLFFIVVGYLKLEMSFRMAAGAAWITKRVSDMGFFAGCNDTRVAHFAHIFCAANLQKIGQLLRNCWAFGMAIDLGSKHGTSYLDIRPRFECHGMILNLHLLATPLFDGKTASVILPLLPRCSTR